MPLRRSTLLFATLAIWTVAWAMWTADVFVEPVPHALERALRRLPLCLFGAGLCLAMAPLLVRVRSRGATGLVLTTAALIAVSSVAFAAANEVVFYLLAPRWGPAKPIHILDVAMLDLWVFLAWSLLFLALLADSERRDRELALARTQALALDAQHRLLVQQAQPHFLFNALNTVYALVLEENLAGARTAVLALSNFLRRSIEGGENMVTLASELHATRDYLAIEMLRFGDRLRVIEDIAPALLDLAMPSLLLQPLVENSIKHGLAGNDAALTITITAALLDGTCSLRVDDDGRSGDDATGSGIGHANIRQRLNLIYGGRAALEVGPLPAGGYRATVVLPCAA